MKKLIPLLICILLFNACREEKPKDTKKAQPKIADQLDTAKTDALENNELPKGTIEEQKKAVNHLFVANGGSILYMKNGDIKGQARFDTDGDFVTELLKTKTYGKYKDYENYVISDRGDTTAFFEEDGRIGVDWVILKGIGIKSKLQIVSYTTPMPAKPNETELIATSKLIIFSPEKKSFANENTAEAKQYFTAMDDWNFYSNELSKYLTKLKVETYFAKMRYLTFEIENGEKITVDTKSKINNYKVQALLYKKGNRPIIVYLTSLDDTIDDMEEYLKTE